MLPASNDLLGSVWDFMRIIAGEFRGRSIASPPDTGVTRPITDRAKQSLFDALQDCFFEQTVLDCFAGTGSIGLECLSRGAAKAIFVERDRRALAGLKENLRTLGLEERAAVIPGDAYAAAENPSVRNLTIAFVDPPYAHAETGHERQKLDTLLHALAARCMIDGGIISFRHPLRVTVDTAALAVKIIREFRYGEMAITWLTPAQPK